MKAIKKHFIATLGKEACSIGQYTMAKSCLEFIMDNKKMEYAFNYLSLMHMRVMLTRARTRLHDEYTLLNIETGIDIKPLIKEVDDVYLLFLNKLTIIFIKGHFDMEINYIGDISDDDLIDLDDVRDLLN